MQQAMCPGLWQMPPAMPRAMAYAQGYMPQATQNLAAVFNKLGTYLYILVHTGTSLSIVVHTSTYWYIWYILGGLQVEKGSM
jgi:hypothetical protein